MTTNVFDKATELLSPGASLVATGSGTGILLYPRSLPTCDWCVYASGVVGTGTYTLNLQVSDVVGGTYTTIASITWPPATASGSLHIPINGHLATFFDTDCRYMRVNYAIGGATPGIVLGSYIGKPANNSALAVDVGDIFVAA